MIRDFIFYLAPDSPSNFLFNEIRQSSANIQWSTGATVNIHRISVIYYDQAAPQTKYNSSSNANFPTTTTSRSYNATGLLSGHVYCFTVEVQSYNKINSSSVFCNRTSKSTVHLNPVFLILKLRRTIRYALCIFSKLTDKIKLTKLDFS